MYAVAVPESKPLNVGISADAVVVPSYNVTGVEFHVVAVALQYTAMSYWLNRLESMGVAKLISKAQTFWLSVTTSNAYELVLVTLNVG